MLKDSQPLDSKFAEKLMKGREHDEADFSEDQIKTQFIGEMFEDIFDDAKKQKISLGLRLEWLYLDIKGALHDLKYAIRNHFKWRKTIKSIRPWEGFGGLLSVMITHLKDYIDTEEKYGHSEEQYRKNKIATARETVALLKRMKDSDGYYDRQRDEVESRYPEYKYLITKYKKGGSSSSCNFIAQGKGWAGKESGENPQAGYFEFINGKFQLTESPDQNETNRLLDKLENYHKEITNAYKQAVIDSDKDFDRLVELLKENMYSWWD